MANAHATLDRVVPEHAFEIDQLTESTANEDATVVENRDTRGVVAAVLESTKTVDQDIHRILLPTDISHDSTHVALL